MPTSGRITYYSSSNTITINVNSNGIKLNSGDALYYKLPIGQGNSTINGNYFVANYLNSSWILDDTCVLIALRNTDSTVKYLPAGIQFSTGITSTYSTSTNQWLGLGKTIYSNTAKSSYWSIEVSASDGKLYVTPCDANGNVITGKNEFVFDSAATAVTTRTTRTTSNT